MKGKGGKTRQKKKVIKRMLKYLCEAYITAKKSQNQGRILEGRGGIFPVGQNISWEDIWRQRKLLLYLPHSELNLWMADLVGLAKLDNKVDQVVLERI